MAGSDNSWFGPSERALEFGTQYATVLARWGELFGAASELVAANVTLGNMAVDSATEFESWVRTTAGGPWAWMSPDSLQRFMSAFTGGLEPRSKE
jgi:hypothetical protein